jgi:hypothetical protein
MGEGGEMGEGWPGRREGRNTVPHYFLVNTLMINDGPHTRMTYCQDLRRASKKCFT